METCFKQVFNFNFVVYIFQIDSEREALSKAVLTNRREEINDLLNKKVPLN